MPTLTPTLASISYSVFEDLNRILARLPTGNVFPLHQGKTWFDPLDHAEAHAADVGIANHQHAPPGGIAVLRNLIAKRLTACDGPDADADRILVTAGATHAISLVLHAVLEAGDEVLVAAPQWLFAIGLIEAAGGKAVEVPIFDALSRDRGHDFIGALDRAVTGRTRALYLNTPNNPTGYSMRLDQLRDLAAWARRRDIWLIADNAYENYDYTSQGFRDIACDAPELTFSVYTFSKTYAMPGWRIGFLVCPPGMAGRMRKWGLYSVYSISTASQQAAMAALATPAEELAHRRAAAEAAREIVATRLVIPRTTVEGGLYTWLDLSGWKGGDGDLFVRRCAETGIGLAPGRAFGACGAGYARLCFTAVRPDRLIQAIDAINTLYLDEDLPSPEVTRRLHPAI